MRKIFLIIILVLFLAPFFVQAWIVPEGLVPCGGCAEYGPDPDHPGKEICVRFRTPCQLCHIFVLFDNILRFIFFTIVPPLAILMIAIGGFMYMFSGGSPSALTRAKSILTTTGIALLIIYGAWLIVDLILTFPGLVKPNFSGWHPSEWFQIRFDPPCPGVP